jgi:hypothetical protein
VKEGGTVYVKVEARGRVEREKIVMYTPFAKFILFTDY